MHLRNLCFVLFLIGVIYATLGVAADPLNARDPSIAAPSDQDIEQAIDKLKADPNLSNEQTTRTLKWKSENDKKQTKGVATPGWLRWIGSLFSWLGETARVLVWLLAALFAAILVVWIIRFLRAIDGRTALAGGFLVPTHVRDLDIRPESLPHDIGKAALELWERGEHRAALSLLYRGLLSRLAHQYAVPILHSSTEGECRVLALQHLPAACHEYVGSLIRTWQAAVYGGSDPQTDAVRHLCAHFGALDAVRVSAVAPSAAGSTA